MQMQPELPLPNSDALDSPVPPPPAAVGSSGHGLVGGGIQGQKRPVRRARAGAVDDNSVGNGGRSTEVDGASAPYDDDDTDLARFKTPQTIVVGHGELQAPSKPPSPASAAAQALGDSVGSTSAIDPFEQATRPYTLPAYITQQAALGGRFPPAAALHRPAAMPPPDSAAFLSNTRHAVLP